MHTVRKLLRELHRRSVWQVLGVYLAGSWGVLQVVDYMTGFAGLPAWTPSFAFVLLLVGLPIVLATAFVQKGVPSLQYDPHGAIDPDEVEGRTPEQVHVVPEDHPLDGDRLLTWRNAVLGGVGAATLLVASVVAYLAMWAAGIGPMGSLVAQGVIDARDPVILADFENRTDDASLAAAVTDAFRVDLLESQVVTLVDGRMVQDALQRMGRTADGGLTAAVAREIAVREGIKAVVQGEISKVGAGYLLATRIVVPEDGHSVAAFRETAADDADLLPAIDRLSQRVREKAGESLRDVRAGQPLEAVTTASLDALRKFAEANRADEQGDVERAIDLLEEAVALDPAFAMAWRKVAVIYSNRGGDRSATVNAATRAYENRDRLSERERRLAEAYYHYTVTGDEDEVVQAYRRVLDAHPDEPAALNNLAIIYMNRQEWPEAAALLERTVSGPGRSRSAYNNLVLTLYNLGRKDDALAALDRWKELYAPELSYFRQRATTLWGLGEVGAARAVADEALTELDQDPFGRIAAARFLGYTALAEGRTGDARRHFRGALALAEAQDAHALAFGAATDLADVALLTSGDTLGELRRLERYAEERFVDVPPLNRPYGSLGFYWAVHGRDAARAEHWWSRMREAIPAVVREGQGFQSGEIYRGMLLATLRGRHEEALEGLRELERRGGCRLCNLRERAGVFEALQQPDSAIASLEAFVAGDEFDFVDDRETQLGDVLAQLARLYEQAGRTEDARAAWTRVADRWAGADEAMQPRVRAARERAAALTQTAG